MVDVSVIVSMYTSERSGYVLDCLRSLKKQTSQPKEVILVLDPEKKLIEFYRQRMPNDVKFAISKGFGLSNARNAGVKEAKGEIVAFIDDDAVADRDWLKNLVRNYSLPQVVGVGGLVKPVWESSRPAWFPEELDWVVGCSYKGLPKRENCVRNPIGCNMSFRKDIFKEVGYFRSDIGRLGKKPRAGEEAELSLRIYEKFPESKIIYDPSVVVYHRVPEKRAHLKYVVSRSFHEGLSKASIANSSSNSHQVLSSENRYLLYLLKVAIPSRFRRIHKAESISQSFALLLSISSTLAGYFAGKLGQAHTVK